jgi:hypothetical protein
MIRRFNHLVRCVKIATPQGVVDGWWCYSQTAGNWVYVEEEHVQWILDFLPEEHRPNLEDIRAEAYRDIVYNPEADRPFFIDRSQIGPPAEFVFTDAELADNELPPKQGVE